MNIITRFPILIKMYSDLFTRAGTDIVSKAARDRVGHYLQALKQHFSGKIKKKFFYKDVS